MTGYVFTFGVDGFGADVAPAFEEGCYLNFNKAFKHLIKLNHEMYLQLREEAFKGNGNIEIELLKKDFLEIGDEIHAYALEDEKTFNRKLGVEAYEPWYDMYGLEEIEIIGEKNERKNLERI